MNMKPSSLMVAALILVGIALASALPVLAQTNDGVQIMTDAQLAGLQRMLSTDRTVRTTLGRAVDIVRIQAAALQPGRFVVDLATPARSHGLRVLVDVAGPSLLRAVPLG